VVSLSNTESPHTGAASDDGTALAADHHYVVVSSDNHAGADLYGYKPYLDKKWHDEFDAWAGAYSNPWDFVEVRTNRDGFELETEEVLTGAASWHSKLNWDSDRRLQHMDADGIAAEVIFPNTAPPFMPGSVLAGREPEDRADYERRWAGLQAHNRWLADFCAAAPNRRAGIAQVMLWDIGDAVAEVHKIKELGLTGGILLPMDSPLGLTNPLYVTDLEPFWQACADLEVPIHKHCSAPPELPSADRAGPGIVAVGFAERQFYNHRAVAHLIFSGVLERYPTLKIIFSESGSGWVPAHLRNLDAMYHSGRDAASLLGFLAPVMTSLSLSPSEYFARNFYLGASLFLPSEAAMRYQIGVGRIMWGVDYPHSEGTFPYSREAIALTFADVPPGEVRQMLGATAADVFGFDRAALQAIADGVGPTVADVRAGARSVPKYPDETLSPVFSHTLLADR
jgi:predicted TIM-barrel fold metal-dependent hydrolase